MAVPVLFCTFFDIPDLQAGVRCGYGKKTGGYMVSRYVRRSVPLALMGRMPDRSGAADHRQGDGRSVR